MLAKTLKSIFSNWRKLPIVGLRAGYLKKNLSYRDKQCFVATHFFVWELRLATY